MEQCGAMWSDVERCGAMWSDVERCGAMWSDVEQCGAMWRDVGLVVQGIHIISNKILHDRIRQKIWQQRRCPSLRTPSCSFFGDTRLAHASSLSSLSSVCCCPCVGAVKFARYHFGLAGRFTTYLLYLTSCNVVRCRAMSMSHRQSHAMGCNVARCGAMWRDVGLR